MCSKFIEWIWSELSNKPKHDPAPKVFLSHPWDCCAHSWVRLWTPCSVTVDHHDMACKAQSYLHGVAHMWIGWKDRLCTCGSHRKPFLQSLLQVFSIWRQITHLSCRRFGFFSTLKFGRILLAAIPLMCCNKTSLVISLNSTNNTWGKKRHSTGLEWKSS